MKTKWILFTTLISISLIALIGLFTSFTIRKNISINQNTTDDIIPKTQLQTNYENSLSSGCVVAFVNSGSLVRYRTATITSVSTTQMTMLLYNPNTSLTTPIIYFNNGEIFTVSQTNGSSFTRTTTPTLNGIYKYTLKYTSSSGLDITGITAAKITSTSALETDSVYGITSTSMENTIDKTTEVYGFYANYLLTGTIQKLSQEINTTTTSKTSGMLINMSPTSTILGTPIFNSNGELLTMIFYNYYDTDDSIDSILFACDQTQFKTTFATT